MAIWQADFPIQVTRALPPDFRARLCEILPVSRPLFDDMETWGAEDGTRVDLYFDRGKPNEGLLRLDLRAWDPVLAGEILARLRQWGCNLLARSGAPLEPVLGDVALAARCMPAFRFVEDPERFFRRLQAGGLEDA